MPSEKVLVKLMHIMLDCKAEQRDQQVVVLGQVKMLLYAALCCSMPATGAAQVPAVQLHRGFVKAEGGVCVSMESVGQRPMPESWCCAAYALSA